MSVAHGYLFLKDCQHPLPLGYLAPDAVVSAYELAVRTTVIATDQFVEVKYR